MASLWKSSQKLSIRKEFRTSSPEKHISLPSSAQNSGNQFPINRTFSCKIIKERLLFTLLRSGAAAGMAVEAALVLPLCLFFLLNLGSAVEMIRLHNNLQLALWDTGSRLSLYGCEQSDSELASLLSAFYVRNRVIDYAGEEYLNSSPIPRGSAGLRLWESEMLADDLLDIKLTYSVETPFSLGGFYSFRMANHYAVHLWNGYEISEEARGETIVYMTENGSVYHKDRNCTHLQLTVRETTAQGVYTERNRWGAKYDACERCAGGRMPELVYVTSEGTCYHYRADCAGLKRTVHALILTEPIYPFCSRCGS